MTQQTESQMLAIRLQKRAADGLGDVKFLVRNIDEATEEAVCREVNRLYDAVERGEAEPLDFRDSCRP